MSEAKKLNQKSELKSEMNSSQSWKTQSINQERNNLGSHNQESHGPQPGISCTRQVVREVFCYGWSAAVRGYNIQIETKFWNLVEVTE